MPNQLKRLTLADHAAPQGRRAGEIDVEIGRRIRQTRTKRRVTQEDLAKRLGLSCQQLQKYESGSNRISVSRLVQVAQSLNADVTELLTDDERADADGANDDVNRVAMATASATSEPTAQDVLHLVQAFCATRNSEARTKILEMARFFCAIESN